MGYNDKNKESSTSFVGLVIGHGPVVGGAVGQGLVVVAHRLVGQRLHVLLHHWLHLGVHLRGLAVGGPLVHHSVRVWGQVLVVLEGRALALTHRSVMGGERLQVQDLIFVFAELVAYISCFAPVAGVEGHHAGNDVEEISSVFLSEGFEQIVDPLPLNLIGIGAVDAIAALKSATGEHGEPDAEYLREAGVDVRGVLAFLDEVGIDFFGSLLMLELPKKTTSFGNSTRCS